MCVAGKCIHPDDHSTNLLPADGMICGLDKVNSSNGIAVMCIYSYIMFYWYMATCRYAQKASVSFLLMKAMWHNQETIFQAKPLDIAMLNNNVMYMCYFYNLYYNHHIIQNHKCNKEL